jgi:hypothetical protein
VLFLQHFNQFNKRNIRFGINTASQKVHIRGQNAAPTRSPPHGRPWRAILELPLAHYKPDQRTNDATETSKRAEAARTV